MRKQININKDWGFTKDVKDISSLDESFETKINLPHTWNNVDGIDGGNDYFRGTCAYIKELSSLDVNENEEAWLEFKGAAMSACVFLNGELLIKHQGGYSTFRTNLTSKLTGNDKLVVLVDNNKTMYILKVPILLFMADYIVMLI